ncbi:hypothetical protein [Paraconexibacter sp.]|uniref:hypothetical protein n=1 Tax=Paraconexibacter sp. TaxID=2949640 RepID=UPI003566DFBF
MSDLEPTVPPAGEEIYLPEGSLQPLLLTLGVTAALLGLTVSWYLCGAGVILSVWVIVRWIQDTRKEIDSFPADSGHH